MKQCHFCVNNLSVIDYKDTEVLRKFINTQAKILPRRKTGTCALCQRRLTRAIKHARHLALLPFTLR
jgi:small subunit ribosomal protein S18